MPIPDYQTLMLPLLQHAADQKEHRLLETEGVLADAFSLLPAERAQVLPSGKQRVFNSRVSWAITYLKKAKLLESKERGVYFITPKGLELLAKNPPKIDNALLRQYEDFSDFYGQEKAPAGDSSSNRALSSEEEALDPIEALDKNYQRIRHTISDQLLETVKQTSPAFFEVLVVDLLLAMGYGGSHQDILEAVKGRTGDEGIDGVIKEDPLGLEEIYIQAKRYKDTTIGRPLIQSFAGSMVGFHARKGVFITTSSFSQEARNYIQKIDKKIALIDGQDLVQLMIDHNVGVTSKQTYTLKQIDSDYFEMN